MPIWNPQLGKFGGFWIWFLLLTHLYSRLLFFSWWITIPAGFWIYICFMHPWVVIIYSLCENSWTLFRRAPHCFRIAALGNAHRGPFISTVFNASEAVLWFIPCIIKGGVWISAEAGEKRKVSTLKSTVTRVILGYVKLLLRASEWYCFWSESAFPLFGAVVYQKEK